MFYLSFIQIKYEKLNSFIFNTFIFKDLNIQRSKLSKTEYFFSSLIEFNISQMIIVQLVYIQYINFIFLSQEYFLLHHQCHPLSHDQMAEYCKIIMIHLNLFSMKLGIDYTSPPIKI